jgi:PRD1 phage membrane DNA delivery
MSDQLITSVTTVLLAIVGVAIVATLVSKNANTAGVLQAGGQSFSQSLGTALSPVTGSGGFGSFGGGGAGLSMSNL